MGYFETERGLPPDAEAYSPEFLELDAVAGPWLSASQASSPIARGLCEWRFDPEAGTLAFGDGERIGIIARAAILGTYDTKDGTWLWAWANPHLDALSADAARVRDEHPEIPELAAPSLKGGETKAWALAAAAAHLLEARGCYRLPGEGEIVTFVALLELEELAADDPRAQSVGGDAAAAAETLAGYAGPAALSIGALVLECLEARPPEFDPAIAALHAFCERLEALEQSPLGRGTPAGHEACELAVLLRQGALCLSLPPNDPSLAEGIEELLGLLHHLAQRYGALPEEEPG